MNAAPVVRIPAGEVLPLDFFDASTDAATTLETVAIQAVVSRGAGLVWPAALRWPR